MFARQDEMRPLYFQPFLISSFWERKRRVLRLSTSCWIAFHPFREPRRKSHTFGTASNNRQPPGLPRNAVNTSETTIPNGTPNERRRTRFTLKRHLDSWPCQSSPTIFERVWLHIFPNWWCFYGIQWIGGTPTSKCPGGSLEINERIMLARRNGCCSPYIP